VVEHSLLKTTILLLVSDAIVRSVSRIRWSTKDIWSLPAATWGKP
jgi:hypothetical protein